MRAWYALATYEDPKPYRRRPRVVVLLLLSALVASGCATGTPGTAEYRDPLAALSAFAQADLQAALDDATKHQDQTAIMCYQTLLGVLAQAGPIQAPQVTGAVSAFQVARDVVSGGPTQVNTLAQTINRGCAALFVDANFTIAKLAAMGAAVGLK